MYVRTKERNYRHRSKWLDKQNYSKMENEMKKNSFLIIFMRKNVVLNSFRENSIKSGFFITRCALLIKHQHETKVAEVDNEEKTFRDANGERK